MHRASFVVLAGMLGTGCATLAPVPPPAPGTPVYDLSKNEVVVTGKAPAKMPGIKPEDEGTEFIVFHGKTYRCTRVGKAGGSSLASPISENPRGFANCRSLSQNESRVPDPGKETRAGTQGVQR
ncbi:MAG TPA: hypothetical protein VFB81_11665 [Myxococcales bacterium]|nr:hypothetical protein [Myxococcales bacterium]